jgi:hypothetical protein
MATTTAGVADAAVEAGLGFVRSLLRLAILGFGISFSLSPICEVDFDLTYPICCEF